MAENRLRTDPGGSVRLIDPANIERNPQNPRLIFREDELKSLQESIAGQGILVPLTVYQTETGDYIILDGERRWRCALRLGLTSVPAIVQPQPDPVTNIMMMFAIHKTRNDWDPLPTAIKLFDLQQALAERLGRPPTEKELGAAASLDRGEVRRYRNIMALPEKYKRQLLAELKKPRNEQVLTVDHVLESTRGALALRKQAIIDETEEDKLVDALVAKFLDKLLTSTVDPRLLTRMAGAVHRKEIDDKLIRKVVIRLINEKSYTISDAFRDSIEKVDFEHGTEQLAERVSNRLVEHLERSYELGDGLEQTLRELASVIRRILRDARG
ncbi:ParB/RepB/Spo0J family partition protein [Sphingomonas sp. RG327]|uniref:ParB/RepB/Spo0J family partition protein n=1 Tax=Sphingomonas anseongensis TaxID=2908207 RepID=A0ABT0RCL0_9SPHN|nr:ParB/RepB/Spo0J family partition protein [Sphingomonas anseongensis]MCL6677997.1 ParB/RepB/Spo0J family partition protein [Sphingomonas anseongensis]